METGQKIDYFAAGYVVSSYTMALNRIGACMIYTGGKIDGS